MGSSFAQSRKDGRRVRNFIQQLDVAESVFAAAEEAELELTRLQGEIKAANIHAAIAADEAVIAEASSTDRIKVAVELAEAAEVRSQEARAGTASKFQALNEEEERNRLDFVAHREKLAEMKIEAEEQYCVRMSQLARLEEVAQASLARVEKQRMQMIADLNASTKEMPDATSA